MGRLLFVKIPILRKSSSLMDTTVAVASTLKELMEPRIVGGSNANCAAFPAMVLLGDRYKDLVHGATLIYPTLILTAAHCQEGVLMFALIGEYNTSDLEVYQSIPMVQEFPLTVTYFSDLHCA
jgi:secreted trypsin-like serine protease